MGKRKQKINMANIQNTNTNLQNYSRPSNEKPIRENLYKRLKVLPFKKRCIFHTGVQVYKALNNMSHQYIRDLLTISYNQKYNLRSISHGNLISSYYNY
jgi:hypothetical protein